MEWSLPMYARNIRRLVWNSYWNHDFSTAQALGMVAATL